MSTKKILFLTIILFIVNFVNPGLTEIANASHAYEIEPGFSINWGEQAGELAVVWNEDLYDYETWDAISGPSPMAISESGGFVITEYDGLNEQLMHLSIDGNLIAEVTEPIQPFQISVSPNGYTLTAHKDSLMLYDSDLNILRTDVAPGAGEDEKTRIYGLFPTNNNSFWVLFYIYRTFEDMSIERDIYLGEYDINGFVSQPVWLYTGEWSTGYMFVTPEGNVLPHITDKYGYRYEFDGTATINRYSPIDELVFSHSIESVEGWTSFDTRQHFFIDWSGDFYTLHATESGAVLTKYDLHVDPVCDLLVITPRPHTGPSPVAIEFDASGTYDDDGDTLTFHWDFDGDKVFDEPVDDAYTGDPSNPTHEYTADYEGAVNLRVTDNYQGECDTAVILSVDVQ